MPVVFRWNHYRFFFFSNEEKEPPHIHISKGGCEAKFWLADCSLAYNDDFKHNQIVQLREVVKKNQKMLLEKWYDYEKRKY